MKIYKQNERENAENAERENARERKKKSKSIE